MKRETFGSRLGFLLISAGCAIGLGNVWRFPYIAGQYGGAAFILLYLFFLIVLTVPILVMEFSVGRASRQSIARAFDVLEPKGTKWHLFKWVSLGGNYLLMMFYTVITGWMLSYVVKSAAGSFTNSDSAQTLAVFNEMLANPAELVGWMFVVVLIGLLTTGFGLKKGVERISKIMMVSLLAVLIVLVVRIITLPGAEEGLAFYLMPDFHKLFDGGVSGFFEVAYAAMSQAFFTLSVGIGSMAIFGSYTSRKKRLTGEALRVASLDTGVALLAGLIVLPACFAYHVEPSAGPGLVFQTLPIVFDQMPLGQLWSTLFFLFLSFAALSTIIAVFEAIMAFTMDLWGVSRKRAVLINGILLFVLSIPCALGFNVLSFITIPGIGDIQGIEDFLVSSNLLPLGSLVFLLFCTTKKGWGWNAFMKEVNAGSGKHFPESTRIWIKYAIPVFIIFIFVMGYVQLITKITS